MTTSKTSSKKDKPYAGRIDLSRLFGAASDEPNGSASSDSKNLLPIELIHRRPEQVRRYFDPEKMEQLTDSIRAHGILENLIVRPMPGKPGQYELVAGERRYRAAQAAGLEEVPVSIINLTDQDVLEITLIENLQREDLNPVEETEGILQLLAIRLNLAVSDVVSMLYRLQNKATRNLNHNVVVQEQREVIEEAFRLLGRMSWQSFVKHRLPLRNLPDEILNALKEGKIAYTKAQAIARVKNESKRQALLKAAISEDLSLAQIKEKIASFSGSKKNSGSNTASSLRDRMDATYRLARKSNIWEDPKRHKQLEKLLLELEALIKGDE